MNIYNNIYFGLYFSNQIDTEFMEVLGFRQEHNSFFEKSDISFICMLHPLSFDIKKQELEIEAAQVLLLFFFYPSQIRLDSFSTVLIIISFVLCSIVMKWMPFEEYAAQPFNQKHEPFKYINELCIAKMENIYTGFCPRLVSSFFSKDFSYIYLNRKDLDKSSS